MGSVGKTLDTVTFADGMKRLIQTKKEADVNGIYGMVNSGLVVYDELARTIAQGQPLFQPNGSGDLYGYLPQQLPKNPTRTGYDPLDRTVRLETPDAQGKDGYAVTATTYGFGKLNTGDIVYATTKVVDPIGTAAGEANRKGTKVSFKDVDERIAAVVEYNNGSPITTTYAYDPLGEITTVRDNRGNTTTVEYDLVGRRTAITNPDTGRTEYGYDANGNLTSKLTANYQRGKEIKYNYIFNRLMQIDYPYTTSVTYEYGPMVPTGDIYNRAGRITKVTDESGTEERYYGNLGETTREVKSVDAKTPSAQRKSYTTDYVFDSFGRMNQMTYPDGENLYYAYDNGGLLKAAWGEKRGNRYNYINSLTYDEFGQRRHIAYGNGVSSDYSYDDLTRRLATLTTVTPDSRTIQNMTYGYDLVGNVLKVQNAINTPTNTVLPAGPVVQVFEYDDLYQLKTANGEYAFGPGKQNLYSNEFLYDTIGNFTRKGQIQKILQPSMAEHLPKETNYVLDYKYGSTHPHAVTDAGDKLYSYDANGNMTGWTSKTSGKQRTILWNEENRVKEIDDNGKATYFLYDDAGERVLKRGQHGETFYLNRFYSIKNGELGTKCVYAGNTRVVSKLVKTPNTTTANTATSIPGIQGLNHGIGNKTGIINRLPDGTTTGIVPPEEKDQYFYHGDHLGSSNMITDASGSVYQHLEYFPYGETWIDEGKTPTNIPGYQFTGKELDPETGLYYFGARYYEPVISRWISADPIDRYHPASPTLGLSLYQYALHNPLKFLDPTGYSEDESQSVWSKLANWYQTKKQEIKESIQGASISVGTQATQDAAARRGYNKGAAKLRQEDPRASAERSRLRTEARKVSSPTGKVVAETMRPSSQSPRPGGRVNVTNSSVNKSMEVAGKAGPVLMAVGVGISTYNVATAPEGQTARVAARESGSWLGAISFGSAGGWAGAETGAAIGVWFGGAGAVPGAAIGGIVGSVLGGVAGSHAGGRAGENAYDMFNGP
ncbi:MAG TPA: RHS repeat-associated core domain-containing protein [Geobacteraceae bacterium]